LRSHGRDDPHQPTGSRRAVSPSKSTSPRETQQQQRARHESNGSIDALLPTPFNQPSIDSSMRLSCSSNDGQFGLV